MTGQIFKQANILGEVSEDTFLLYSFTDHSFGTWNGVTGEFKRCNIISCGSNKNRNGNGVDIDTKYEATGGPTAKDCILADRAVHYKSL